MVRVIETAALLGIDRSEYGDVDGVAYDKHDDGHAQEVGAAYSRREIRATLTSVTTLATSAVTVGRIV